jgi:hypothetical protein
MGIFPCDIYSDIVYNPKKARRELTASYMDSYAVNRVYDERVLGRVNHQS